MKTRPPAQRSRRAAASVSYPTTHHQEGVFHSQQRVIDMRSRPSFLHDFYGKTLATPEFEVVK